MVIFQPFGQVNFKGIGTFRNNFPSLTSRIIFPYYPPTLVVIPLSERYRTGITDADGSLWCLPFLYLFPHHLGMVDINLPLLLFPSTPLAVSYVWIIASLPICLSLVHTEAHSSLTLHTHPANAYYTPSTMPWAEKVWHKQRVHTLGGATYINRHM